VSPEFDSHLRDTYTDIVAENCEISVQDGWFDIIDILLKSIERHISFNQNQIKHAKDWNSQVNDPEFAWDLVVSRTERTVPEEIPQVSVYTIKEKFGIMRVYHMGGDDYINGLVSMAESMTSRVCEVCGEPGELRHEKWIKTLCDHHMVEYQARINGTYEK
jgi:hypothetical protein